MVIRKKDRDGYTIKKDKSDFKLKMVEEKRLLHNNNKGSILLEDIIVVNIYANIRAPNYIKQKLI